MPLLLALYWLSVLEVASAHGVLSVVGKYEIKLTSPAPCITKAAGKLKEVETCDYFYQALLHENVNFTLVVNTTISMTLGVRKGASFLHDCTSTRCGDSYDQDCSNEHCDNSEICTYSCSTDEQLTRHVNVQKFLVVASLYDQRLGDNTRTVCVQVDETKNLKFQSDPGPQQSTSNGSATFIYIVDGYPLPNAYELVCNGRVRQRSEQGVFQLTDFSYGVHECFAIAHSRIEHISSNVTQLTVELPRAAPSIPTHEPATQDLHYYTIAGVAGSVAAVIVLLVLAAVLARKVVSRRQSKVPPSVVNIHNDNSQHTTYIHNGPKVESYGPNSTIVVDPVAAQLLKSGDDWDHSNHRDWVMQYGAQACSDDPESVTYTFIDANDASLSRDSLER